MSIIIEQAPLSPSGGESTDIGGMFSLLWRTFKENRLAVISLGVLVFFVLFSFVGPFIYHTNQTNQFSALTSTINGQTAVNYPWFHSWQAILGTDSSGYNIVGRLMMGGRTALVVGFLAGLISTVVGSIWGAVSGYRGKVLDTLMMRFVDLGLSVPGLFLLIVIVVLFGASSTTIILTLGFTSWFGSSRLIRGETLSLKSREFVHAVKVLGGTNRRIIFRHILPNTMGTMIVVGTFAVADSILALAALGFIGLGIPLPNTDWGDMLNTGVTYANDGYWWEIVPAAICIIVVVIALNYIGDAMRDAFEVRLQKR
ncbi:MAG: ABC transporter permease [Acidimicrobiales bacterium]|jgi:peptide/nickel transport system permease protein